MYECQLYTATIFSSVSVRYVRIFSVHNISANMAIKVEVQHIQNWSNLEAYTITSGNGHIIYWHEGCLAISIYISFFLYCMAHSHHSIYIDQLGKKMHGMPYFAQITQFDLFSLRNVVYTSRDFRNTFHGQIGEKTPYNYSIFLLIWLWSVLKYFPIPHIRRQKGETYHFTKITT